MPKISVESGRKFSVESGRKVALKVWTPSRLSNVACWWDFGDKDSMSFSSGVLISQVNDKSGNGHHLVQPTTSKQPSLQAYPTDANTLNSAQSAYFDDDDEMYVTPNPFGATIVDAAIIFAYKERNRQDCTFCSLSGSATIANRWQYDSTWGDGDIYFDCGGNTGANRLLVASGYAGGTPHITSAYCSDTDDVQAIHIDGDLLASDASGHQVTTVSGLYIGSLNGGAYIDGDLGEVIVIDGTMSTSDRQKIEGYLAHRWGLAGNLDAGHPYKSAPPAYR